MPQRFHSHYFPNFRSARPALIALGVTACLLLGSAAVHAEALVLIVANNRSLRPHLPDLQYADDDGIRYYQLLESLLPDARISLLVDPDASTARANPAFARLPRAPTRANLLIEASALAEAARQAREAGRPTTFYFVFAGHGDVEGGRGFVELADARFGADDLQALIKRVGASEAHVLLDSCNSYFMMAPRKPGGRRFSSAMTIDLMSGGQGLEALPSVGAFLSTSSEQTVYEWSEIQSGIFSYLVRSGLMGGADADGDGRITYDELRSFVAVASGRVPNPAVRPNVYARGPNGDGSKVLLDINQQKGARTLELPAGRRMVMRSADGYRLAELHTEEGFTPRVRLWGGPELRVEMMVPAPTPTERPSRMVYTLPDSPVSSLSQLAGHPATDHPRGPDRMFQALFELPFGPRALARDQEERRAAPPLIYGLARADADRLILHLDLLSHTERDARFERVLWRGATALALGLLTLDLFTNGDWCGDCRREKVFVGSSAALFAGLTIWNLFPSASERLTRDTRAAVASSSDPGLWLPKLSEDLDQIATRAQRGRWIMAGVVGTALGLIVVSSVADMIDQRRATAEQVGWALFWGAVTGGTTWLILQESTEERQIRALKADPLWQSVSLAAAPAAGGLRLALGLRF